MHLRCHHCSEHGKFSHTLMASIGASALSEHEPSSSALSPGWHDFFSKRAGSLPASRSARYPPQTVAMEDDPLLSVTVLSTRMVYGKASCRTALDFQAWQRLHHPQHKAYRHRAPPESIMYTLENQSSAVRIKAAETEAPPLPHFVHMKLLCEGGFR